MNELCNIFKNAESGKDIILEKGKVYHIYQDDSFELTGYYCSNTAKKNENPTGLRRTAVYLKSKKDITIDGNGAKILVHGKMTPFLFDKCENITVKNLTVDYACPTMSEFTVLSNENGICKIKINDECFYEIENNELIFYGEKSKNGTYFWKDSYISNKRHYRLLNPETKLFTDFSRKDIEFTKIKDLGENTLLVELKNKNVFFPKGSIIQTRNIIRDQTGALSERCKNICFENVNIKFMHGLGMVSQFCENITYRNCDFTPAKSRTAASTADFFQFSGCKGEIIINNVKAWGAHDDYINVHGTHLKIIRKNKRNKTITVRFMHPETWGFQAFEIGDKLEFINRNTLKPYNETTVTGYKRLNNTDIRLQFDRALPDNDIIGDVVENITWTPDLTVKNCEFGLTCGRGILCTTRGKVIIENNSFKDIWGPALLIEDDCNFWYESGYTKDITFKNNSVDNCNYIGICNSSPVINCSPKVIDEKSNEYVHEKIIIEGNHFKNSVCGTHFLNFEYLNNVIIKNNTFDYVYKISTKVVGNVEDNGNTIINKP